MRVAIIGPGSMGEVHADAWAHTEAQIAAVVGKAPGDGATLAARYGSRFVTDLDAVLPDVDVVDICTPTHLHAEFALRAARAGKHVICEKPLALTVADGEAMIHACRAAGVRLLVAHVLRFFPEYRLARELVVRGDIGAPAVLRLSRCTSWPRKPDNWFVDPARSGGMILDLMIHDFDYARWVAGDVVRVFAKAIVAPGWPAQAAHALAILTHRGGALSHIEGSWAFPPPTFRTRLEVAGAGGLIACDGPGTAAVEMHLHPGDAVVRREVPLPESPLRESPYTTQLRAFHDALVRGSEPAVRAADGLEAVRVARAAIESARSGVPVTVASPGEPT